MSIIKFFEGIKFNFINFFAFWIFNTCVAIWMVIIINDTHADNPHVAEIRTACQTIAVLVIGYFFGASQGSKRKDDTLDNIVKQQEVKDQTIHQLSTGDGKG